MYSQGINIVMDGEPILELIVSPTLTDQENCVCFETHYKANPGIRYIEPSLGIIAPVDHDEYRLYCSEATDGAVI